MLEGPLQGLCSGGVAWGPQEPGTCLPMVSVVNHWGEKIFILLILWLPRLEMQKSGPAWHRLIVTQMLTMKIARIGICITGWGLSPADTVQVWWPSPVRLEGQRSAFSKPWLSAALLYPGLQLLLHPGSRTERWSLIFKITLNYRSIFIESK